MCAIYKIQFIVWKNLLLEMYHIIHQTLVKLVLLYEILTCNKYVEIGFLHSVVMATVQKYHLQCHLNVIFSSDCATHLKF